MISYEMFGRVNIFFKKNCNVVLMQKMYYIVDEVYINKKQEWKKFVN